jgi:outer membrane protein assembly factor BamB
MTVLKRRVSQCVATVLVVSGCGLACEPASRIDGPPADRVHWKVSGSAFPLVPTYDSVTAFFASKDHQVIALDRRNGNVRWKSSTANGPGGVTAGFNLVTAGSIVAVGDVDVYAFDRVTGAPAWSFRASDDDETGTHAIGSDGSVIYTSSYLGRVYALDSQTGQPLWITQVPGPSGVHNMTFDPTVAGGEVFVGLWHDTKPTLTGGIAALDAASGRLLWTREFQPLRPGVDDSYCTGGAVVSGGLVIVGASDGQIYGLDAANGAVKWIAPPVAGFAGGDDRALALSNDVVVASSNSGTATGINVSTGAVRWSTPLSSTSLTDHSEADSQLAIFTTSEIIAVDPQSGSIRWRTGVGKQGGAFWGYPRITPEAVLANGLDGYYSLTR